jgi:hypothetical protein
MQHESLCSAIQRCGTAQRERERLSYKIGFKYLLERDMASFSRAVRPAIPKETCCRDSPAQGPAGIFG